MSDSAVAGIRSFLQGHRPVDDRERISIARFLVELDRLARPFAEHDDPFHVTASAVVIGRKGVILHRHKRLGIWIQPGGHVEDGEQPQDAVLREVLEETGLGASHFTGAPLLIHVDVHAAPKGHTHLDLRYVLRAPDAEPCPLEGESPDVLWVPLDEAMSLADPGLTGVLQALRAAVSLRLAGPADAAAIAEVHLASFADALAELRVHDDNEVRRRIRDELLPANRVMVAEHPLGFVVGYSAFSDGRLQQLFVDPAWQRRGIGGQLLRDVIAAEGDGFDLWTFQQNIRARSFYEAHGFVAVEFSNGSRNIERAPDVRYALPGKFSVSLAGASR